MISDQQLLDWNAEGLIPGPDENESQLSQRATYCLHLKERIHSDLEKIFPLAAEEIAAEEILDPALQKVKQLYEIAPHWIPLFFSNEHLTFWHGGSAWIFQQDESSPISAFFQLRRQFKNSDTYLGIYKREEIIVHELCHVGRMAFEEPKFEEIIAWQSSSSGWRRWLGPIIQSSWESALFVLILLGIVMLDVAALYWQDDTLYQISMWAKLLPVGLVGLALGRLWSRQTQFSTCLRHLQETVQDPQKARAILYRLTDQEILLFSRLKPADIKLYSQSQNSLRWRLIHLAYGPSLI